MSKIYLAGASSELPRVEMWAERVRACGYTITHPWWLDVRKNIALGRTDADLSDDERAHHAKRDLWGIRQAAAVWVLAPAPPNASIGCWVEMGFAMASLSRRQHTFISGDYRRCLFALTLDWRFDSDEQAFAALERNLL